MVLRSEERREAGNPGAKGEQGWRAAACSPGLSPALPPRPAQPLLGLCDLPARDRAGAFGRECQTGLTPQISFWPQRHLANPNVLSLAARRPRVPQPFVLTLTRTYEKRTHQRAKNHKDQCRSQLPAARKPLFSTPPCKRAVPGASGAEWPALPAHFAVSQSATLDRPMQTHSSPASPTQKSAGTESFFTIFLCGRDWKLQSYHHTDQIIWRLHNTIILLGAT